MNLNPGLVPRTLCSCPAEGWVVPLSQTHPQPKERSGDVGDGFSWMLLEHSDLSPGPMESLLSGIMGSVQIQQT